MRRAFVAPWRVGLVIVTEPDTAPALAVTMRPRGISKTYKTALLKAAAEAPLTFV